MSNALKTPFGQSLTAYTQSVVESYGQLLGQSLPCIVTAISGAIVTVNFQVNPPEGVTLPPVTCPIAESTYIQLPVQIGDFGLVIPANTRLGGITGLGLGLAPMNNPSNLGGLVFFPIGNKSFTSPNANAVYINGPEGVIIQNTTGASKITITPTSVTIDVSGNTVVINASSITSTVGSNSTVINSTGVTSTVGTASIALTASEASITAASIVLNGGITFNGDVSGTATFDDIVATEVTASGVALTSHLHSGVTTGSGDTGPPV